MYAGGDAKIISRFIAPCLECKVSSDEGILFVCGLSETGLVYDESQLEMAILGHSALCGNGNASNLDESNVTNYDCIIWVLGKSGTNNNV